MKLFSPILLFLIAGALSAKTATPSGQIDRILEKSWKTAGVEGNPPASDEIFLRRIYLDTIGRIPSYEEAADFLASTDKNKRAKLIDELLASEGYVNHFFNFWADILRINIQQGGGRNVTPYYIQFVRDALRENTPYDEFVRAMISAEGQAWSNGAIGYTYRDRGMPLDHMANTVRIFLGTRLECAQCHNHPFDQWTQMDFFHMAAFSYGMDANNRGYRTKLQQLQRSIGKMEMDRAERANLQRAFSEVTRPLRNNNMVSYDPNRLPALPHDYQYDDAEPKQKIQPATMFGAQIEVDSPGNRVDAYADWMTSPENPRFTTVIANRLWKKAMGMGLIEPVDELMDSTQPSNAELMNFLEGLMIDSGYDVKGFLRAIFNSKAYQREATLKEVALEDDYPFTGPILRRMSAEQIWDSVVAMVNPFPESNDWKREQQFQLQLAHGKAMSEAIGGYRPEEIMSFAKKVAQHQKQLNKRREELTQEINAARKAKDQAKVRELSQKSRELQNELRSKVHQMVYQPALRKAEVQMVSLRLPNGESEQMDVSKMVGANGQISSQLRRKQSEMETKMFEREMAKKGITEPAAQRAYLSFRRNSSRMLRAAHIGSPAPNGHFLRQFGQSDRETIENANDEASVPQALQLMNGSTFPQIVGGSSQLYRNLQAVESVEEKIELIYLSLLNRPAADEERKLLLTAHEARGEKIYQDTIFALLNSQEFLFVQ